MLKAFIFGGYSVGDGIVEQAIKTKLKIPVEYCGNRVDLSKITPEEHNIIIIINRHTFELDLDVLLGYIKKDLTRPFVILRKIKTFGGMVFEKDMELKEVFVNKIFIFAGIFYFPKDMYKTTMAELFRGLNKDNLRAYFLKDNHRK